MGLVKQWKGVNGYMVNDPGSFFSEYNETHGVGYPLQFMLLSFVVAGLVPGLISFALNLGSPTDALINVAIFIGFGVVMWLLVIVEALIAHGILSLAGGNGLSRTFEAYAFPSLVRYGLWWFPLLNILFGFYGLYLQVKGLSTFHDVSSGKALVAAVFAAVLTVPVILVILAVIVTFVFEFGEAI